MACNDNHIVRRHIWIKNYKVNLDNTCIGSYICICIHIIIIHYLQRPLCVNYLLCSSKRWITIIIFPSPVPVDTVVTVDEFHVGEMLVSV